MTWRRDLTQWTLKDLNISRHQGKIHNGCQVDENPSCSFVYIKSNEGSSIVDPFYKRNFDEAKETCPPRGLLLTSCLGVLPWQNRWITPLKHWPFRHRTCSYWWILREDGDNAFGAAPSFKRTRWIYPFGKERTGVSTNDLYLNEAYYHLNLYPEFNHYHLSLPIITLPPELGTAAWHLAVEYGAGTW